MSDERPSFFWVMWVIMDIDCSRNEKRLTSVLFKGNQGNCDHN